MKSLRVGIACLCSVIAAPSLASIPGQATTPSGSAFASSCAGIDLTGGFAQDGAAIANGQSTSQYACSYQTSAPAGSATSASAQSGAVTYSTPPSYPYSAAGSSAATLGTIHLSTNSSGSAATQFSGAQVMAGWNDSVEIAGASGQTGVWLFSLLVDGALTSTGPHADSQASVMALQNNNPIEPYGDALHQNAFAAFQTANGAPGTDVYYSFDYELKPWRETQYGVDKSLTLTQAPAYFAVPFTYNVPFTLGIYGFASSGSGSSGAYDGQNSSIVDLADTISWAGKGVVITNGGSGARTTTFSVQSLTSSFNYNLSAVPEPMSWTLMALGSAAIGGRLRAKRRGQDPVSAPA